MPTPEPTQWRKTARAKPLPLGFKLYSQLSEQERGCAEAGAGWYATPSRAEGWLATGKSAGKFCFVKAIAPLQVELGLTDAELKAFDRPMTCTNLAQFALGNLVNLVLITEGVNFLYPILNAKATLMLHATCGESSGHISGASIDSTTEIPRALLEETDRLKLVRSMFMGDGEEWWEKKPEKVVFEAAAKRKKSTATGLSEDIANALDRLAMASVNFLDLTNEVNEKSAILNQMRSLASGVRNTVNKKLVGPDGQLVNMLAGNPQAANFRGANFRAAGRLPPAQQRRNRPTNALSQQTIMTTARPRNFGSTRAKYRAADYSEALSGEMEAGEREPVLVRRGSSTPMKAGWNAAAFGESTLNALLEPHGLHVPGSTVEDSLRVIEGVVDGKLLHPKRYGDETLVQETISSGIINLTDQNYTPGNILVAFTPTFKSHKGAFILQMPGGSQANTYTGFDTTAGPTRTLVAAVSPDRDAEDLGVALNNQYARLKTSIPTIVGGTNIVTAQISQEMGEFNLNPMLLVPGKAASVARNRHAPISIIGAETHAVHSFSANVPTNQIRIFNPYDSLNSALVRTKESDVSGHNTVVEAGQLYNMYLPCTLGTDSAIANGYNTPFGIQYQQNAINPGVTDIWSLAGMADPPRHFLFGQVTIQFDGMDIFFQPGIGENLVFSWLIDYADGQTLIGNQTDMITTGAAFNGRYATTFSTDGLSVFKEYDSVPISNIRLQVASGIAPFVNFTMTGGGRITFHDVPSTTTYLATLLTGAQVGAQLNFELSAHTEIRPDPSTRIAQYITPTSDLPYDPSVYPMVLLALEHLKFAMVDNNVEAATFGNNMKRVFRKFKPVARQIAGKTVRYGAPMLADTVLPGSGEYVRGIMNAAAFSGGKSNEGMTGFSFPAVKTESDELALVAEIDIMNRIGKAPDFVRELTPLPLTARHKDYNGSSDGLAFLLAALTKLGYPTRRGIYSGRISSVYATPEVAEFVLEPVDLTTEKIAAYPKKLSAMTVDGWYHQGKLIPFNAAHLFGPVKGVTAISVDTEPGTPGRALKISVTK